MIRITSDYPTHRLEQFLNRMQRQEHFQRLDYFGQLGVDLLSAATPIDSKLTASSWNYRIIKRRNGGRTIVWNNTNIQGGAQIAVLLQYGHATGNGGWVEGHEYMNPVLKPLFDQIANYVWEEVKRNG